MLPDTQIIRVNLAERSYDIEIGAGNLAAAGRFLTERTKATHVVLVTDDHVHKPHAMRAAESLGDQDIEVDVIVVTPGEEAKSIDVAASLWQGLLELGADRHSVVAAVGGGVVGDLAGFIAATYARGLRFLQVPTSLLAQVDSSVGGKVGINLPEAKNMIGAFHQPLGVLIDTATLATLPANEFRNGLAEVVKYGVVLDAELFGYLEANAAALVERRQDVLVHVIARCCRLKADVVEKDEREESGLRAVLNFGHTFGHAFETLSGYWHAAARRGGGHRHDVCRAIGRSALGRVDAQFIDRLRALLQAFGLPVDVPKLDPQQVLDTMMHDKKAERGQLRFVLPSCLGRAELWAILPSPIFAPYWSNFVSQHDRIRQSSRRAIARRTGRHAAAFPDSRRGAADSQGAPGTVRHGPGGAGGGAERAGARSTASARNSRTRSSPRTTRSTSRPRSPCAGSTASTFSPRPTPPTRVRSARFTIRRACCSSAAR